MWQHGDLGSLALDLLPCGVAIADATGRLAVASHAARVLLGLKERDADDVVLTCAGQPVCLGDLLRDHAAGQSVRRRLELTHPEHGRLHTTLTRVARETGGPMVHLVVERGPRRDWRWAGSSDPLAVFAHELRNALTSLRDGLDLLGEGAVGPLTEVQQRLFDGVREDAARMVRLTENMLVASRARAGRVRVAARCVDVTGLARKVVRSFEPAAARGRVRLALGEAPEGISCNVDADLVTQALANLVGNALKFTPPGGSVTLAVRRLAQEAGEAFVGMEVRDTGQGLPPDQIRRILDWDGDAGGHAERNEWAGLGLGLAIVRAIIEQHGGRLEVESEPGAGSCFRLVLPSDFRQGEHWQLMQIADGMKLARVVGVPLSIVEIAIFPAAGAPGCRAFGLELEHLALVEQCLEENLRPSDTVVVEQSSATLVLYDVDGAGARRVASRAVGALMRLLPSLPEPCASCTVGAGVASYPADAATAAELAEAARREMMANRAAPSCSPGQESLAAACRER